jgi:hypothetical protein
MNDTLSTLIGDVPVSEQLAAALERMAPKDHIHEYATHDEVENLKKKIDLLMDLVGDTSVSEQIQNAIRNIK